MVLLRGLRTAHHVVWQWTFGDECLLVDAARGLFATLLDHGDLQLPGSVSDSGDQEVADDYRLRDRVDRRGDRHVAGTILDNRAFALGQIPALCVGRIALPTDLGGDNNHRGNVCRDGDALHDFCEGRSDYLGVGTEGRSASRA